MGYFEALNANSSTEAEALNEAEWLTDTIVRADQDGRAIEFAENFSKSNLRQVNNDI